VGCCRFLETLLMQRRTSLSDLAQLSDLDVHEGRLSAWIGEFDHDPQQALPGKVVSKESGRQKESPRLRLTIVVRLVVLAAN